jgi:DNA polymerase-3 subunit delta'
MPFSSLFGLDQPIKSLRNALAHDQIAGTYLFTGPQGVGKTALALAFAQAAACANPRHLPQPPPSQGGGYRNDNGPPLAFGVGEPLRSENDGDGTHESLLLAKEGVGGGASPLLFDACGECEACRRLEAGKHPEVHLIAPAGEQTQIWQFWDRDNRPPGILQHTLSYSPSIGRLRVYILERADTLNESAANSLLKALEEPPPYALFILLSPHAARMLPTILSRAQLVRLTPAPVADLAAYLERTLGIEPERARTLAAYAEGRTGTALRLARNPAVETEIAKLVELAEWIADGSSIRALRAGESIRKFASGMKALADTAAESGKAETAPVDDSESAPKERVGRRQLGIALDMLATVYRDLAALSLGGSSAPIVHAERRDSLARIASSRAPERWVAGIETLLLARRRVDQNASVALLTDWLAMRLATTP